MQRFSGTQLRTRRLALGLRAEHLAVAVGRSVESIRGYEAGRIDPPAAVVGRLAAAVGAHPGDLFESVVEQQVAA